MDGRGGCCIARYAGAGAYDMSKVDRIMLRFRPIAPKPVAGGTNSAGGGGRQKRKCARSVNNNKRRRKQSSAEKDDAVVTLPLLPEAPDPIRGPMWLSFENYDPTAMRGSWVRVESVTEAWMEGDALGRTDEERRWKLSRDTC